MVLYIEFPKARTLSPLPGGAGSLQQRFSLRGWPCTRGEGASSPELPRGLLSLGFWFRDLGFRDLGFLLRDSGIWGLGFRVLVKGFGDLGFRV